MKSSPHPLPDQSRDLEIIIPDYVPPSLNVLMRMHWARRAKLKKNLAWLIRSQLPMGTIPKFHGPVSVHYIRYSSQPMDIDNLYGSFKLLGDALQDLGIIQNDSPDILKLKASQVVTKGRKTRLIISSIN